ncbi:mgtC family protein [Chondrocystis sp. NIES-4102]|nr:mgtC family protein [Chondrocystis sp. NIES-4102]
MTWIDFGIRLTIAFMLGMGIGIERQWLKTRSVLKTNVLVTLGAAMFVMLSVMTPGDASPTRIAAQVVSGIGFLGGGVILRDGASVRGINTAATLWCAAAIGSLVGAGHLPQAYFSTAAVVGANLLLRPMVQVFQNQSDRHAAHSKPHISTFGTNANSPSLSETKKLQVQYQPLAVTSQPAITYMLRVNCYAVDESRVLNKLWRSLTSKNINLTSIQSHQLQDYPHKVEVLIEFVVQEENKELGFLDAVTHILQSEVTGNSCDWEFCRK